MIDPLKIFTTLSDNTASQEVTKNYILTENVALLPHFLQKPSKFCLAHPSVKLHLIQNRLTQVSKIKRNTEQWK